MSRVQILTKTHFWWFYGWNFNASVKSKMDQCVEWFLTFCFTLGRKKICTCFNFNGGSFIYLKLRDFDVRFVFTLTRRFLKFLMSSFYLDSIGQLIWVGLLVTEAVRIELSETCTLFLDKDMTMQIARVVGNVPCIGSPWFPCQASLWFWCK